MTNDPAVDQSSEYLATIRVRGPQDTSPIDLGETQPAPKLTLIGDYEVLNEIARGGMGIVYKARQRKLNRVVALKVTRAGNLATDEDVQRLQTEATAAAKLDHPNIVPVYEVGEAEGTRFFSMAFIEGESLGQTLARGPLPPLLAALLIKQVALAVDYAHRQGVIHRDIKPSNILLDTAQQPRITDFGLAKCAETDSGLTQSGQIMGTPSYMAPEQAENRPEQVGPLADVYALGATLYSLLTGRPPFQAATALETVRQVVEREPISPRQLNPDLDLDLDTICLKCLQKRPERRYCSAAALADDLQRFLDHRPIQARPVGPLEKMERWCRRNKLVAACIGLAMGTFLIAFLLVSWSYWRVENALVAEQREREKAERKEQAERWERYRANIVAAAGALRLHNVGVAKRALEIAPEEHRDWEWWHFHNQLDLSTYILRSSEITSASPFVPSGPAMVTSRGDRAFVFAPGNFLQVWDISSRRLLRILPFENSYSKLSSDGRLLAAPAKDNSVVVIDVDSGKVSTVFHGHDTPVYSVHFSDDKGSGPRLATGDDNGTVRVWDIRKAKQLLVIRPHKKFATILDLTPDGKRLLTCDRGDSICQLWDVDSGNEIARFGNPGAVLTGGMFSPVATASDRILTIEQFRSNKMRLWDIAKKEEAGVMSGHTNQISASVFSPDGTTIASCGMDQTIRLWNGIDGKPIATLRGHNGWVNSIRFSKEGKHLVSASQDRTVRLWDVASATELAVLHGHLGEVFDVGFTADGATIVSIDAASTARLWDARMAAKGGVLRGHTNFAYSVAFHPDGQRLASTGWDGTVRLWDATIGDELSLLAYDKNTIVSSLAFHPSGELLASLGRDNAVRLWDVATSRHIRSLSLPGGDWRDSRLAFNKSGDLLAAGNKNGAVYLWGEEGEKGKWREGIKPIVLHKHSEPIRDVAFSPDSQWLAAASDDKTISIWDLTRSPATCAIVLDKHTSWVYALAWSPDGKLLASGSTDGTVRLWDNSNWQEVDVLRHGTNVYSLAFTPSGTRLACACADNTIRLWDVARRQEVAELHGHEAYVHAVAFSSDGTRLASASGDFTVRVWDKLAAQERTKGR